MDANTNNDIRKQSRKTTTRREGSIHSGSKVWKGSGPIKMNGSARNERPYLMSVLRMRNVDPRTNETSHVRSVGLENVLGAF